MLQNPRKTLGFKKNMVFEISSGGGGKPYLASGLYVAPATTIYEFGHCYCQSANILHNPY